jgi:sodium/proline symporter
VNGITDVAVSTDQIVISLTFFVYLLLLFAIGWAAYTRTRDLDDFILGGRRLGSWTAALSAGASDMSGWLLLGLPGFAYLSGVESIWLAAGLLAGTWLNWRTMAAPLRSYSEIAGDSLTIPAFLRQRFRDDSGLIQSVSAIFILLFFVFYTSSGLVAGGKLFQSVFGLDYTWAVAVGTCAIVLYTAVGGFLAVSWTDLMQALLMLAALIAVPIMAINELGGIDTTFNLVKQTNPDLLNAMTSSEGVDLSLISVLSLLGWGLGYFGQPHILARFKGIESVAAIPKARRIAVSWTCLTLAGASLAGIAGIGYLDPPLSGADSEKVFIQLVGLLFHPVIAGICLSAILAAIMSTADSQLLVAASALTADLYKGIIRKRATPRELMWAGRLTVILIAFIAFLLALNPESKVLDLVAYAWAGFGAAFGPTLLLSLYWKRMNRMGALAGILTGGITVVIWKQLSGGLFDLYEIIPGFILSGIAIILFSLMSREPGAGIVAEYVHVKATTAQRLTDN